MISGIQQLGIGVSDVRAAFKWYREAFGMDVPIFEEAATAALMLPYTGGQPRDRHAILALNMLGGGGMEIWQYTSRTPVGPDFRPKLGDLGLFCCKMKAIDVEAAFHFLRKKEGATILGGLEAGPDGRPHFFVRDPFLNVFEITSTLGDAAFFQSKKDERGGIGGVFGAILGVSDLEKSKAFYSNILGYDTVVFEKKAEKWRDLAGLDGGFDPAGRVLLRHSEKRRGPFAPLLGPSEIELVQVEGHTPRRIFENRLWGDLGFIHLCFDITGMDEMREKCARAGRAFTVDSATAFEKGFDMGEAAGHFSYIEDPDGALIEFVETHKIPILKKLGWYLDLRKRSDRKRPLPRWMLKALGFGRVK